MQNPSCRNVLNLLFTHQDDWLFHFLSRYSRRRRNNIPGYYFQDDSGEMECGDSSRCFFSALWLPIGIHWAWNFMEGNIFGFYVSGHPENYRMLTPSISGPNTYTGGDFGPEASIIAIILGVSLSAWFIWRYYKFQRPSKEQ